MVVVVVGGGRGGGRRRGGTHERWRDGRHDWERQRGRNFFSLWSSIGSAACCLVTAAPFEKHSVSLEISLRIHSQSAYKTFLLTIGQQHAIWEKQCSIVSVLAQFIIYLSPSYLLDGGPGFSQCSSQLTEPPFCVIKHNNSTLMVGGGVVITAAITEALCAFFKSRINIYAVQCFMLHFTKKNMVDWLSILQVSSSGQAGEHFHSLNTLSNKTQRSRTIFTVVGHQLVWRFSFQFTEYLQKWGMSNKGHATLDLLFFLHRTAQC